MKSKASSADLPMPCELEALLRAHLTRHDGKSELLFVNRRARPLCADKLRERRLHPLLKKLGIEKSGFQVQRQLRHSDPRITLAVYAHVLGDQQRTAVQNRSARLGN